MVLILLVLIVLVLLFGAGAVQSGISMILLFIAVTTLAFMFWLWATAMTIMDWAYLAAGAALLFGAAVAYFSLKARQSRVQMKNGGALGSVSGQPQQVKQSSWAEHHWIRITANRLHLTEEERIEADAAYAAKDTVSLAKFVQIAGRRRNRCISNPKLVEAWRAFELAMPFVNDDARRLANEAFASQQTAELWNIVRRARSGSFSLPEQQPPVSNG